MSNTICKNNNHTSMIYLYGIANCDQVRLAKKFLTAQSVNYEFIDFKKQLDKTLLRQLVDLVGWDKLINKRARTYGQLSDKDKDKIIQQDLTVVLNNSSLIKRPILQIQTQDKQRYLLGFNEKNYRALCQIQ